MAIQDMLIASLLLLLPTTYSHASETDAFTVRYTAIDDSTDILDAEVNRRLDLSMDETNEQFTSDSRDCNTEALFKTLKQHLHRPVYGILEGWIKNHTEIPHALVPLNRSVYREIRWWENLPVHMGLVGFGPVLRINGHLIGNDKIGHFLDEGLHNFNDYNDIVSDKNDTRDPIAVAVAYGVETEKGMFGLKVTGVYSYADSVANLEGMNFWMRLMGKPIFGGGESYFTCDQGKWKRNATFTFRDYISAAWDEGMNCNEYRDESYRDRVLNEIAILEKNDPEHRRYSCPVVTDVCDSLVSRYGVYARDVLNPKCLSSSATSSR